MCITIAVVIAATETIITVIAILTNGILNNEG